MPNLPDPLPASPDRLTTLLKLFLKLGIISFGGPVAHIAMMEEEIVKRRKWLTQEHFLDLVGATNLIPGPNSTEMAIHIGYLYAGWAGLLLAGISFILPAVLITMGLAALYVTYGNLPLVLPFLYGIKPAVLAVVVDALWRLSKKAMKSQKLWLIGLAVAMSVLFFHINEVLAIVLGGLLGMLWLRSADPPKTNTSAHLLIGGYTLGSACKAVATTVVTKISLWQLGWIFFKIGCVLFGGGYVLMAFLQGELVDGLGWLTQQQLLDAIAIGQFTPGPILSTATFVGYILAGVPGAIVATVSVFLPSFVFVALLNPLMGWLRSSKLTSAFLDAVNASAIALMGVMVIQFAQSVLLKPTAPWLDPVACGIALVSGFLAIRYKVHSAGLVIGGGLVGGLLQWIL
jgi:chromate transporter